MYMENILLSIDPIIQTTVQTLIKINIEIVSVDLFKSCSIRVGLYNDKGFLVMNKLIVMDGDDYKNWSNDDNYIIEFVKKKIATDII